MSKQSEKGKPSPLSEINIRSLQISIGTGGYCDGSDSEHDLEVDGHDECEMVSGITTLTRDVDQGPQEPIRCKRGMFLPCLLFIVCVSAVLIIYWKGGSDGDGDLSSMTVMTPENQNGSSVSPSSSAKANTKSESVEGNVIEFTVANLNTNTNKCTHVKHVLQCIPSHNEATNKFRIRLHPEWGPIGVSRFQDLTTSNFWRDIRIFRVVPDFISQFGISSYPDVQKGWSSMAIQDDPVIKSNDRGTVSFATSGENTRSTQLFINTNDNWYLDTQGFAPIGEVLPAGDGYGGMEVVNEFQNQYGEKPNQAKIREEGEDYLRNEFPLLSYFVKAEFVDQDIFY